MAHASENSDGYRITPVSAEDVARVVGRALTERTWRLRLTSGQRLAILRGRSGPAPARA